MKGNNLRYLILSTILFACFLSCTTRVFGQFLPIVQEKTNQQTFTTIKALYDQGQFAEVLPMLKEMLVKDPDNSNLNFLIADCLLHLDGYEKDAKPFLEKAIKNTTPDYVNSMNQRKAPVFSYMKMGDLLYEDYLFDEALINYKIFKVYLDEKKDKDLIFDVNRKIETATNAKMMVDNVVKVSFSEIPFVNTGSFSDFSAHYADKGNTMYFTRKRIGSTTPANSDILYMKKNDGKWGRPVKMPFINSDADDVFCSISKDGSALYFSSNRSGKYHIYVSARKGTTQWSQPELLNANVNGSKSEETFAFISADSKTLYFVSDRKGGYGGKDIYVTTRTLGGDWGAARNMGNTVNTTGNEESPSISDDGKTFYFSSDGHPGIGGYDVFVANISGGTIREARNMGFPINTLGDDLFYNRSTVNPSENLVSRSKAGKSNFAVTVLTEAATAMKVSEVKQKEQAKQKPKLKLVPKTLKY